MSSSAATLPASLSLSEATSRAEHCTAEKALKRAVKTKHDRAETVIHSDTEWKPDDDSEEYASSGRCTVRV